MVNDNNYLSIMLPDNVKAELVIIQERIIKADKDFRPVQIDTLHMTIAFFGEKMRKFRKDDLKKFHQQIQQIIQDTDCDIKLSSPNIIKFPPGKDNLYVMSFDTNHNGQTLVKKIRKELGDMCVHIEPNWMPHITLGKMRNKDNFQKVEHNLETFIPSGIMLCGKKPNGDDKYLQWIF
jgi:2'-5' RNA ligase